MSGKKAESNRSAGLMSGRRRFISALFGGRTDRISVATPTSFVTVELQELTEAHFPDTHLNPNAMVRLCAGAVEIFGCDAVCPTLAVANEVEAKRIVGDRMSIVGNIDNPVALLLGTSPDVRRASA
ncbi:MAG: hypothetical protein ACK2TX_01830 [Anaerolineales bacterium]